MIELSYFTCMLYIHSGKAFSLVPRSGSSVKVEVKYQDHIFFSKHTQKNVINVNRSTFDMYDNLYSLPNDKNLGSTKLKTCADNRTMITWIRENVGYQYFFSSAVFEENLMYCYSLRIVVVIEQKLWHFVICLPLMNIILEPQNICSL